MPIVGVASDGQNVKGISTTESVITATVKTLQCEIDRCLNLIGLFDEKDPDLNEIRVQGHCLAIRVGLNYYYGNILHLRENYTVNAETIVAALLHNLILQNENQYDFYQHKRWALHMSSQNDIFKMCALLQYPYFSNDQKFLTNEIINQNMLAKITVENSYRFKLKQDQSEQLQAIEDADHQSLDEIDTEEEKWERKLAKKIELYGDDAIYADDPDYCKDCHTYGYIKEIVNPETGGLREQVCIRCGNVIERSLVNRSVPFSDPHTSKSDFVDHGSGTFRQDMHYKLMSKEARRNAGVIHRQITNILSPENAEKVLMSECETTLKSLNIFYTNNPVTREVHRISRQVGRLIMVAEAQPFKSYKALANAVILYALLCYPSEKMLRIAYNLVYSQAIYLEDIRLIQYRDKLEVLYVDFMKGCVELQQSTQ